MPYGSPNEGASPWSSFSTENGPWNGTGVGPTGGRTWRSPQTYGGAVWYPACGYRWYTDGMLRASGDSEFLWYSHPSGTEAYDSGFYWSRAFYSIADDPRTHGFSVRCVRE